MLNSLEKSLAKNNKLKSIFLQNDANNLDDACNECNLTTSIIEEGTTCF